MKSKTKTNIGVKKTTRKLGELEEFQAFEWPLKGSAWGLSEDYIRAHWSQFVLHALQTAHTTSIVGFLPEPSTEKGGFVFHPHCGLNNTEEWVLVIEPPVLINREVRTMMETFSTKEVEYQEQKRKHERRQKAIDSLTKEQREALGF